jgi:hypothetical protein
MSKIRICKSLRNDNCADANLAMAKFCLNKSMTEKCSYTAIADEPSIVQFVPKKVLLEALPLNKLSTADQEFLKKKNK